MELQISLFAGLADRIGTSSLRFACEEAALTAGRLKQLLAEAYPAAASLIDVSFVAVNQEYAAGDSPIAEHDEVALIPPVSGGEDPKERTGSESEDGMFAITESPLSIDRISHKVITANHGATLTFIGTTREMTEGRRTIHLEYEAYVPMALAKLRQIGAEIGEKWPGTRCAISHRIGRVDIAEASVVIAVSSPHRAACYEASRYAIERLKQIVPIWKKEAWEDGSEWKGHGLGPWDPSAPGTFS
ncbi:molybdopterin converting factor subunit 1 [Paenibacillus sp. alder61]|uniref:molybdopterin converting factor subunit 1 n=1 Tax=Paenibacillus sp. alder61 TaxID=2862948 RepID=UPI001CD76BF0|nr:molybdopterin converting factor subunit 1 [Paenibacillus sp. alder61]MCA1291758.1 molybdopterin converting factor subunit 1 [Paenibacillus sp. alder61]